MRISIVGALWPGLLLDEDMTGLRGLVLPKDLKITGIVLDHATPAIDIQIETGDLEFVERLTGQKVLPIFGGSNAETDRA